MKKISLGVITKEKNDYYLENVNDIVDEIILLKPDEIKDLSILWTDIQNKAKNDFILMWSSNYRIDKNNAQKIKSLAQKDFDNANLISVILNFSFNQKGEALKSRVTNFIYEKESFYWRNPVFSQLVPNDIIKQANYKDILINKAGDEDLNVLVDAKDFLENTKDPYVVLQYGEELIRKGEFNHAITILQKYSDKSKQKRYVLVIEKLINCYLHLENFKLAQDLMEKNLNLLKYPRFLLLYADLQSFKNLTKGKIYYEKYVSALEKGEIHTYYDYERFNSYPYEILGNIYLSLEQKEKAKEYFLKAVRNSKLEKKELKDLISKI